MSLDYFAGDASTNRERMLAGDLYIADDPENARLAHRGMQLADEYHRVVLAGGDGRAVLAEPPGTLGEDTYIKPPLSVDYGENLHVGARTFINNDLTALDVATIAIGDDVWLGGGVIVCPGVTIGSESVIGAGSVVTRDIPARVIAVGNPARVVREV